VRFDGVEPGCFFCLVVFFLVFTERVLLDSDFDRAQIHGTEIGLLWIGPATGYWIYAASAP
jgi:hypothetical protein